MKKKLGTVLLAMALVLTLGLGVTTPVKANGPTIEKSILDADEDVVSDAYLGDHLTIKLKVTGAVGGEVITDTLPDELHYISDTFKVNGESEEPTVDRQTIAYTLEAGEDEITFEVQVTSAEAEDIGVANTATLVWGDPVQIVSASANLTIHPYAGFTKGVLLCTEDPWNVVPIETDVHWLVLIKVENILDDAIEEMQEPVVKDRLGGDLELDTDPATKEFIHPPWSGDVGIVLTGKTEKVHLTWSNFGDLTDGSHAQLWLEISTDINPGTGNGKKSGHQEYTSAGEHDLNSGAVLKFVDPETGFQLSAHTPPLTVTAE